MYTVGHGSIPNFEDKLKNNKTCLNETFNFIAASKGYGLNSILIITSVNLNNVIKIIASGLNLAWAVEYRPCTCSDLTICDKTTSRVEANKPGPYPKCFSACNLTIDFSANS